MTHINVTEYEIKFWKEANINAEGMRIINYDGADDVLYSIPVWTNVITNVPLLPAGEVLFKKRAGQEFGDTG